MFSKFKTNVVIWIQYDYAESKDEKTEDVRTKQLIETDKL